MPVGAGGSPRGCEHLIRRGGWGGVSDSEARAGRVPLQPATAHDRPLRLRTRCRWDGIRAPAISSGLRLGGPAQLLIRLPVSHPLACSLRPVRRQAHAALIRRGIARREWRLNAPALVVPLQQGQSFCSSSEYFRPKRKTYGWTVTGTIGM